MNKKEFYKRFCEINPGVDISNNGLGEAHSDIYFERLSMAGLEEMHKYSVDERLYEFFEFKPFVNINETKAYLEKLLGRMAGNTEDRNSMYWFVRRRSDNYLIGTAGLVNLNYGRQSVEWGTDQNASLEVQAMNMLYKRIKDIKKILGSSEKTVTSSEIPIRNKLRGDN